MQWDPGRRRRRDVVVCVAYHLPKGARDGVPLGFLGPVSLPRKAIGRICRPAPGP
jgi:hypothetical protein